MLAQRDGTGYTGLIRAGAWNLYGRVAPFADCGKFTPPAGTAVLCEDTLRSERPGSSEYLFASSPGTRAFGFPDYGGPTLSSDADYAKIEAFSLAVILGQPSDYLAAVARDCWRYVQPTDLGQGEDGLNAGEP